MQLCFTWGGSATWYSAIWQGHYHVEHVHERFSWLAVEQRPISPIVKKSNVEHEHDRLVKTVDWYCNAAADHDHDQFTITITACKTQNEHEHKFFCKV